MPAAVATTVLLWASAFVGIRSAGHHLSAGALAQLRMGVGSLSLGLMVLVRRERLPARADLPRVLVCGLLWFAVYFVALNAAEHSVDAGTASMLVNVAPIMVALLAAVTLGEGLSGGLIGGCAIALAGAGLIALGSGTHHATPAGVGLCLLAALAYAVGVVLQKPLLARSSALATTWACCTVGALACTVFTPALVREAPHAGVSALTWAVYLGVFPTAIAFTTWAYALARTSASRLAVTTYVVPPITLLMAWLMLGELARPLAVAGGALCLVGVAVARRA